MRTISEPRVSTLTTYFRGLILTWTIVLTALMVMDLYHIYQTELEMAEHEARADFNKDQALRFWAASHGGVYVPASEETPPNPYLSHVPERDIRTPTGKTLTLLNPAYMLRQLMSHHARLFGIRGHITGLKHFGPETAPDEWEKAALLEFEKGAKEVSETTTIGGEPYFRLMRPIHTSQDCLKCHAAQGYKVGDVRGGISVSVPLKDHVQRAKKEAAIHFLFLGSLIVFGLGAIHLARRTVMREMQEKDHVQNELKQARDALEGKTAELTAANKLLSASNQALDEFASIASHDLKEPLRKIKGFGERLRVRYGEGMGEDGRDYIERMQGAAARMQTLIESLLNYSRVTTRAEPFSSVDLNATVSEVLTDLESRIEQTRGAVEIGELPIVHGDPTQLHQLFQNLIGNGLKYHRDGVSPVVCVRSLPCEQGCCRIEVQDNGIGFDESHLDRIFAPFQRLHGRTSKYEGTGMGLAICKKIVERHGGAITARSTPGEGSIFSVTLPLPPEPNRADQLP